LDLTLTTATSITDTITAYPETFTATEVSTVTDTLVYTIVEDNSVTVVSTETITYETDLYLTFTTCSTSLTTLEVTHSFVF
jgi:hypothetical protein